MALTLTQTLTLTLTRTLTLTLTRCRTRPFVAHGSVIVGATSLEQLKHNLDAFLLPAAAMSEEIEREINAVHLRCRDPSSSL